MTSNDSITDISTPEKAKQPSSSSSSPLPSPPSSSPQSLTEKQTSSPKPKTEPTTTTEESSPPKSETESAKSSPPSEKSKSSPERDEKTTTTDDQSSPETNDTKNISSQQKESRHQHPWPLRDIKEPHENDILYGRGGGTNHHPGNKRYRKLVEDRKIDYVNSKRLDKPLVALEIIRQWRAQDPPGRFLKQEESTGLWNDVGDKKAREKTSQALREKAPMLRKQQEEERSQEKGRKGMNEEGDDDQENSSSRQSSVERTRVVGFTSSTESEMEMKRKKDPKLVKKSVLSRDHSLGRDYLHPDEAVTLEGFSWQEPVAEIFGERPQAEKPRSHHPPPDGWSTKPSHYAPKAARQWRSSESYSPDYSRSEAVPAPTPFNRDHSLALNPLRGATVNQAAGNYFAEQQGAVVAPRYERWENWSRSSQEPPAINKSSSFPPPPARNHQPGFLSNNHGNSAFSRASTGSSEEYKKNNHFDETTTTDVLPPSSRQSSGSSKMSYMPPGGGSINRTWSGQSGEEYKKPNDYSTDRSKNISRMMETTTSLYREWSGGSATNEKVHEMQATFERNIDESLKLSPNYSGQYDDYKKQHYPIVAEDEPIPHRFHPSQHSHEYKNSGFMMPNDNSAFSRSSSIQSEDFRVFSNRKNNIESSSIDHRSSSDQSDIYKKRISPDVVSRDHHRYNRSLSPEQNNENGVAVRRDRNASISTYLGDMLLSDNRNTSPISNDDNKNQTIKWEQPSQATPQTNDKRVFSSQFHPPTTSNQGKDDMTSSAPSSGMREIIPRSDIPIPSLGRKSTVDNFLDDMFGEEEESKEHSTLSGEGKDMNNWGHPVKDAIITPSPSSGPGNGDEVKNHRSDLVRQSIPSVNQERESPISHNFHDVFDGEEAPSMPDDSKRDSSWGSSALMPPLPQDNPAQYRNKNSRKRGDNASSISRPSTVKRATSNQNEEKETKRDPKLIRRAFLNRDHSLAAHHLREASIDDSVSTGIFENDELKKLASSVGKSNLTGSLVSKPAALTSGQRVSTIDIIDSDLEGTAGISWLDD